MPDGGPELFDLDSTMEDDDPKGEKSNDENPNEKMDIDPNKVRDQLRSNDAGNQLPDAGAAAGTVLHSNKQKGLIFLGKDSDRTQHTSVCPLSECECK